MFSEPSPIIYEFFYSWLLLTLVVSYSIYKRFGFLGAILFAVCAESAISLFANPVSPYHHEEPVWRTAIYFSAASSVLYGLMIMLAVSALKPRHLVVFFKIIAVLNSAMILAGACGVMLLADTQEPYSLLFNASMSGCFAAVLAPLFFKPGLLNYTVLPAVVLSVVASGQSQPLGILCLELLTAFFILGKSRKLKIALLLIGPPIAYVIGRLLLGEELLNFNGRLEIWGIAAHFVTVNHAWLNGLGIGSFYFIGPWLTKGGQKFLWLHSDWLQIYFELGAIGVLSSVAFAIQALKKSLNKPYIFIAGIGCIAFMCANMPLRFPIVAFYFAWLIRFTFSYPKKKVLKEIQTSLSHLRES